MEVFMAERCQWSLIWLIKHLHMELFLFSLCSGPSSPSKWQSCLEFSKSF